MRKRQPTPAQPLPDGRGSETQHPAAPLSRGMRIAVTVFVAFHLFGVIAWCVPLDSPLVVRCREAIKGYMLFTGLFQKWDMFAPDPSRLNNYISATVTYRDGRTSEWDFPRMEKLGIVDKYFKERYRKYASDNLRLDTRSGLWPDAARYVARANDNPADPPVAVELIRHWSEVPPPGGAPNPWSQFTFFKYAVRPEDVR